MKTMLVEAGTTESIGVARNIGRVRPVLRTVDKIREVFSTLPTSKLYHDVSRETYPPPQYLIYASVKDESLDLLR